MQNSIEESRRNIFVRLRAMESGPRAETKKYGIVAMDNQRRLFTAGSHCSPRTSRIPGSAIMLSPTMAGIPIATIVTALF